MRTLYRLLVGIGLIASAGCASPCDGFSAFGPHQRPVGGGEGIEALEGSALRLALVIEGGDASTLTIAVERALAAAGGGTAAGGGATATIEDDGEVFALLDAGLARGGGVLARSVAPRFASYEVGVRARVSATDRTRITWTDPDGGRRSFDLDADDAPVRLLDVGQGELRLVFTERAGLRCAPDRLVSRGNGLYALEEPPLELLRVRNGRWARVPLEVTDQEGRLARPENLRLLRVEGFAGQVSRFLCHLLCENRPVDPRAEDGARTSFRLLDTTLWLFGEVRGAPPSAAPVEAQEEAEPQGSDD